MRLGEKRRRRPPRRFTEDSDVEEAYRPHSSPGSSRCNKKGAKPCKAPPSKPFNPQLRAQFPSLPLDDRLKPPPNEDESDEEAVISESDEEPEEERFVSERTVTVLPDTKWRTRPRYTLTMLMKRVDRAQASIWSQSPKRQVYRGVVVANMHNDDEIQEEQTVGFQSLHEVVQATIMLNVYAEACEMSFEDPWYPVQHILDVSNDYIVKVLTTFEGYSTEGRYPGVITELHEEFLQARQYLDEKDYPCEFLDTFDPCSPPFAAGTQPKQGRHAPWAPDVENLPHRDLVHFGRPEELHHKSLNDAFYGARDKESLHARHDTLNAIVSKRRRDMSIGRSNSNSAPTRQASSPNRVPLIRSVYKGPVPPQNRLPSGERLDISGIPEIVSGRSINPPSLKFGSIYATLAPAYPQGTVEPATAEQRRIIASFLKSNPRIPGRPLSSETNTSISPTFSLRSSPEAEQTVLPQPSLTARPVYSPYPEHSGVCIRSRNAGNEAQVLSTQSSVAVTPSVAPTPPSQQTSTAGNWWQTDMQRLQHRKTPSAKYIVRNGAKVVDPQQPGEGRRVLVPDNNPQHEEVNCSIDNEGRMLSETTFLSPLNKPGKRSAELPAMNAPVAPMLRRPVMTAGSGTAASGPHEPAEQSVGPHSRLGVAVMSRAGAIRDPGLGGHAPGRGGLNAAAANRSTEPSLSPQEQSSSPDTLPFMFSSSSSATPNLASQVHEKDQGVQLSLDRHEQSQPSNDDDLLAQEPLPSHTIKSTVPTPPAVSAVNEHQKKRMELQIPSDTIQAQHDQDTTPASPKAMPQAAPPMKSIRQETVRVTPVPVRNMPRNESTLSDVTARRSQSSPTDELQVTSVTSLKNTDQTEPRTAPASPRASVEKTSVQSNQDSLSESTVTEKPSLSALPSIDISPVETDYANQPHATKVSLQNFNAPTQLAPVSKSSPAPYNADSASSPKPGLMNLGAARARNLSNLLSVHPLTLSIPTYPTYQMIGPGLRRVPREGARSGRPDHGASMRPTPSPRSSFALAVQAPQGVNKAQAGVSQNSVYSTQTGLYGNIVHPGLGYTYPHSHSHNHITWQRINETGDWHQQLVAHANSISGGSVANTFCITEPLEEQNIKEMMALGTRPASGLDAKQTHVSNFENDNLSNRQNKILYYAPHKSITEIGESNSDRGFSVKSATNNSADHEADTPTRPSISSQRVSPEVKAGWNNTSTGIRKPDFAAPVLVRARANTGSMQKDVPIDPILMGGLALPTSNMTSTTVGAPVSTSPPPSPMAHAVTNETEAIQNLIDGAMKPPQEPGDKRKDLNSATTSNSDHERSSTESSDEAVDTVKGAPSPPPFKRTIFAEERDNMQLYPINQNMMALGKPSVVPVPIDGSHAAPEVTMRTALLPPMVPTSPPGTASTVPQLHSPVAALPMQPRIPVAANTTREAVQQSFPSTLVFPSIQSPNYGYPRARTNISVPVPTFSSHGRYIQNTSSFGTGTSGSGYGYKPGPLSMASRSQSLPLAPPGMPTGNVPGQTAAPVQPRAAAHSPMSMQNFRRNDQPYGSLDLPSNVAKRNELRDSVDSVASAVVTPGYTYTSQKDNSAPPSVDHTEVITKPSGTPEAPDLDLSTPHDPGNNAAVTKVGSSEEQSNEPAPDTQKGSKPTGAQKRYQWIKGGKGGGHYINPETGDIITKEEAAARGAKPRGLARSRDKKSARTDTGDSNEQITTTLGVGDDGKAQIASMGNGTQHERQDRSNRTRSTTSLESQSFEEHVTIMPDTAPSRATSAGLRSSHGNPTSTAAATETNTTPILSTAASTRNGTGARRREMAKQRAP